MQLALEATEVTITLHKRTISMPEGFSVDFEVDPFVRHCLIHGVDQLGFLLEREDAIAAHESAHPQRVRTRSAAISEGS